MFFCLSPSSCFWSTCHFSSSENSILSSHLRVCFLILIFLSLISVSFLTYLSTPFSPFPVLLPLPCLHNPFHLLCLQSLPAYAGPGHGGLFHSLLTSIGTLVYVTLLRLLWGPNLGIFLLFNPRQNIWCWNARLCLWGEKTMAFRDLNQKVKIIMLVWWTLHFTQI